jgi:hypothetical protein
MGKWIRIRQRKAGPYERTRYYWKPDFDGDDPRRKDYDDLRYELHGIEADEPEFVIDDRAGMAKRPNTSGGGYRSGGDRQSYVFRRGSTPDRDDTDDFESDLRGREYFKPTNVVYSRAGSPRRAQSPGGTDYDVGPRYGSLYMIHPTYNSTFGVNSFGTAPTNSSPLPKLNVHSGEIILTGTLINTWSCTRQKDGANLSGVMSKLSAFQAATQGGVTATGDWAWLHLIAYTMGGQDGRNPDVPENLVAGTAASNIYHLAIESAAKRVVTETGRSVKVSWQLDGTIDSDWHLAERILYTLTNGNDTSKTVTFTIHTWKHEWGYGGDTNAIYSYLVNIVGL